MKGYIFVVVFIVIVIELVILFAESEHILSIAVNGVERNALMYLPKGYHTKIARAAVIVLHGGGESARYIMAETGWAEKAEQEGFVAVFPEGTRPDPLAPAGLKVNQQTWNDGAGRFPHHEERNIDDVAFVGAIIDNLISRFAVDEQRIFVTGFSNGASMALRIGVELSLRVAAIAPVAGGLWVEEPKLSRPVSLLYISGTKDPLPEGGEVMFGERVIRVKPPMQNLTSVWAKMLECPPEQKLLLDQDGVRGVMQDSCRAGTQVVRYSIEGLGHVWPGKRSTTSAFNATDVIWDFFKQHLQ